MFHPKANFSAHHRRKQNGNKKKKKKKQVAKISETIATLSKNALTTSAPPTSAERSGLRKATHQLADLAKSGEWRCFAFFSRRGREKQKQKQKKKTGALISDDDENDRPPARPLSSPLPLFSTSTSFCSLSFFQPPKKKKTEDNVDAVVEGGAVRAVVPLLTLFKVDEGRGVSR